MLEKKDFNLIGNLDDEEDALNQFAQYSGSYYVCDAISEIADGYVPIYTYDIWENAKHIRDSIEEANANGLNEGVTDIEKILQSGYYQYYSDSLYQNLGAIFYNMVTEKVNEYLNTLNEEEYLDIEESDIEDAIEELIEDYDNNNYISDIEDGADSIIERIKDREFNLTELEEEEA